MLQMCLAYLCKEIYLCNKTAWLSSLLEIYADFHLIYLNILDISVFNFGERIHSFLLIMIKLFSCSLVFHIIFYEILIPISF